MRRVTRILLLLPVVAMAAYVVGFRVTAGEVPLSSPSNDEITFGCVHRWDSSFDCPQFNPQEVRAVPTERVERIEITLFIRDGDPLKWTHPISLEADSVRNVDAVFFREPAVSNFYFSYLRVKGVAERIQEESEKLPGRPQ